VLIWMAAPGILAAAGSTALAAHHARPLPKLATGWFPRYAVRPHTIYYTGDGTGTLGRLPAGAHAVGKLPGFLHWPVWNDVRAYGVGTLWAKSCRPDCATSPFYRYAVTVTATRPVHGRFSTMTLRYHYRGRLVIDTRCDTGHGYWTLPAGYPPRHTCSAG
jgi:hypothetical protein